jgi:hypothetical protein
MGLTNDRYDRRMRGVNKVILIGNATRDAELRHTQNGNAVSSLRLATNRSVKGEEETQLHSVVCWDRLAETTAGYMKKGDPLYIGGWLQCHALQYQASREHRVCEDVPRAVLDMSRLTPPPPLAHGRLRGQTPEGGTMVEVSLPHLPRDRSGLAAGGCGGDRRDLPSGTPGCLDGRAASVTGRAARTAAGRCDAVTHPSQTEMHLALPS